MLYQIISLLNRFIRCQCCVLVYPVLETDPIFIRLPFGRAIVILNVFDVFGCIINWNMIVWLAIFAQSG